MQNKYRVIYTIYKEIEADNADEALDKAADYGYDDFFISWLWYRRDR